MSEEIFIPDTNFFINLNFFYNDRSENFEKVLNHLKQLIESKKLIIIDKVFYEFKNDFIKLKLEIVKENENKTIVPIQDKIIDTTFLKNDFDSLAEKYYLRENERFLKNKENENLSKEELIRKNKEDYKENVADLYLILYSNYLKQNNINPIIITDENKNNDSKLYDKIPNICSLDNENIKIFKTPEFIFNYFDLEEKTHK